MLRFEIEFRHIHTEGYDFNEYTTNLKKSIDRNGCSEFVGNKLYIDGTPTYLHLYEHEENFVLEIDLITHSFLYGEHKLGGVQWKDINVQFLYKNDILNISQLSKIIMSNNQAYTGKYHEDLCRRIYIPETKTMLSPLEPKTPEKRRENLSHEKKNGKKTGVHVRIVNDKLVRSKTPHKNGDDSKRNFFKLKSEINNEIDPDYLELYDLLSSGLNNVTKEELKEIREYLDNSE
jgi:hypothetical protein